MSNTFDRITNPDTIPWVTKYEMNVEKKITQNGEYTITPPNPGLECIGNAKLSVYVPSNTEPQYNTYLIKTGEGEEDQQIKKIDEVKEHEVITIKENGQKVLKPFDEENNKITKKYTLMTNVLPQAKEYKFEYGYAFCDFCGLYTSGGPDDDDVTFYYDYEHPYEYNDGFIIDSYFVNKLETDFDGFFALLIGDDFVRLVGTYTYHFKTISNVGDKISFSEEASEGVKKVVIFYYKNSEKYGMTNLYRIINCGLYLKDIKQSETEENDITTICSFSIHVKNYMTTDITGIDVLLNGEIPQYWYGGIYSELNIKLTF